MSHISEVKVLVKDMTAFDQACEDCGVERIEGKRTFKAFDTGECVHAVAVPNDPKAYEAGLCHARYDCNLKQIVGCSAEESEGYVVRYDNFMGGKGMCERIGKNAEVLMRRYTYHATKRYATARGWMVEERPIAGGAIELLLSKPSEQAWASQW